ESLPHIDLHIDGPPLGPPLGGPIQSQAIFPNPSCAALKVEVVIRHCPSPSCAYCPQIFDSLGPFLRVRPHSLRHQTLQAGHGIPLHYEEASTRQPLGDRLESERSPGLHSAVKSILLP